jgi:uncharacterized caspase-like protein
LLALSVVLAAPASLFAERRIAIVVGNNIGRSGEPILQFAERDAQKLAQTLHELGGVARKDLHVLLGQNANALFDKLGAVEAQVAAGDERSIVFFFYSGHADENAIHLGGTDIRWRELASRLEKSRADLRIALVDSCHAGSMTTAKGFKVGGAATDTRSTTRGLAMLLASEPDEVAQESAVYSGSIFTHHLVSGLRGAADGNGDGRVTLFEAKAYTEAQTLHTTASFAPAIQHPGYRFELSGHGDVVLTELREAAARVTFANDIAGQILVTEKGNSDVVFEATKKAGTVLGVALSSGRYTVLVRKSDRVALAEATLPWGGEMALGGGDFEQRSFQEVSEKGGMVILRRHRVRGGFALGSAPLRGMGLLPMAHVGVGRSFGPIEIGLRLSATETSFEAIDTPVRTGILATTSDIAYVFPLERTDLLVSAMLEAQFWRQDIERLGVRDQLVPAAGIGLGWRVPMGAHWFIETTLDGKMLWPKLESSHRASKLTTTGSLALGRLL